MKVNNSLWQHTQIEKILGLFPGQIGELLQQIGHNQHLTTEAFSLIFWRWLFLQSDLDYVTPFQYLEWRKEVERWPEDGLFIPRPSYRAVSPTQTTVDIDVDFIDETEQPFLCDLLNTVQNKPLQFSFGSQYRDDIERFAQIYGRISNPVAKIREHARQIPVLYFEHTLSEWYSIDEVIHRVYSRQEWLKQWRSIFNDALEENDPDTGDMQDTIVLIIREHIPDYGMTNAELGAYGIDGASTQQVLEYRALWVNTLRYIFLPFSLYFNHLALVFGEKQVFFEDTEGLLSGQLSTQEYLTPCSGYYLTSFGRQVWRTV